MSQQINLYNENSRKRAGSFSVMNMLQALGAILFCFVLFYAYSSYQLSQTNNQLEAARKSLNSEQARLASLTAEFTKQRSGMTIVQELKKVSDEVTAQREIIHALKSGVIGNTSGYSPYMQAFARQVVNGLRLTGFVVGGDAMQMSISGESLSPELVPVYLQRLNNESVMRGKTFSSLQMQLPKVDSGKPASKQYLEFMLKSVVANEVDK